MVFKDSSDSCLAFPLTHTHQNVYIQTSVLLEKHHTRRCWQVYFNGSPVAQNMFAAALLQWPSKAISSPHIRCVFSHT